MPPKATKQASTANADEETDAATKVQARERGRAARKEVDGKRQPSPRSNASSPGGGEKASRKTVSGLKELPGSRPSTKAGLDASRPSTTATQASSSSLDSSRPNTSATGRSGKSRANTPDDSKRKETVEPPLGDGPWDYVLHGPPPLPRPATAPDGSVVDAMDADATIRWLLAAKKKLLRPDVTMRDLETYAGGFDRIHGVSSDNLTAFIRTGAFKSLAQGGGAPNDLNDLERCLHKVAYLCTAEKDVAAQAIARLNTLCAIPIADVPAMPLAKRRFRCLLQNVNICVYAVLVAKRGRMIFSAEALAANAPPGAIPEDEFGEAGGFAGEGGGGGLDGTADDGGNGGMAGEGGEGDAASSTATPAPSGTASARTSPSRGGQSRPISRATTASSPMLMASRAHSPAGRSSRPASRAGTFSTFPWQDGLSDAMREVLDLEYVPSRLMDEPVLLTAPPPDLTRCDDFAGTAQSWTRRVMEWLTKYTLTPANIRYFQGTGQGHLFPGLVKLMRKQTSVLGDLDLDEGPGAEPVHRQLAKAIKANHVKVLDLYVCRHSPDYTTPTTQRASTHAAREHTQRASTHTRARTSTHAAHEHVRRSLHSPAHVALVPPPCRACLTPHAPAHAHAHALLPLRLPCRFREWDTSGDGVISKQEFLRAMKQLNYDVPDKEIFKLFDEWDTSGEKELDYMELATKLRAR